MEPDNAVYKTLLESTRATPWRIDWKTMKLTYIGPQIEALVGFMFGISERKKNEEELLRLQRELEVLSCKDGLTNISNRRMLDVVFQREWASACRNQQPLSLILLDIDFFKELNDEYGHVVGDEYLRALPVCSMRRRGYVIWRPVLHVTGGWLKSLVYWYQRVCRLRPLCSGVLS